MSFVDSNRSTDPPNFNSLLGRSTIVNGCNPSVSVTSSNHRFRRPLRLVSASPEIIPMVAENRATAGHMLSARRSVEAVSRRSELRRQKLRTQYEEESNSSCPRLPLLVAAQQWAWPEAVYADRPQAVAWRAIVDG